MTERSGKHMRLSGTNLERAGDHNQRVTLHEMKRHVVEQDLADWQPMLAWLKAKEGAWHPSEGIKTLSETA